MDLDINTNVENLIEQLLKEEEKVLPSPSSVSSDGKLKMVLDTNKNATKKGIKIQFIIPENSDPSKKEEFTQKLKIKLNTGLSPLGLSVDSDMDVPYNNVIGFLIRLEAFKLFIKNILDGKNTNIT